MCEKEDDRLLLKNKFNGETFEVGNETIKEIFKFKHPRYIDDEDFLDNDNLNFYNFILTNNIIY